MRTRFAPSPTGMLHIGGLRTALYCYLLAKKNNGQFILRIEDTDQARSVSGAIENILSALNWLGISPDEGVIMNDDTITEIGEYGPYKQSDRLEIYKTYVEELLTKGKAYYAFDTAEAIDEMRANQKQAGNPAASYDASIRMTMKNSLTLSEEEVQIRLKRGDEYVVRLLVDPNQLIECTDLVRGKMSFKSYTVDDQILLKSDGFPTYHLANIVDDHLMKIDTVLRGEEWLPSLPKHILLYAAFGWEPPQFGHLSLLLNRDGTKLSKRQGDVAASDYIQKGYLPEAMMNFIAFLGWNPGTEQDLFTKEELITAFSMERVQKAGAVLDIDKLNWVQGQWVRKMPIAEFVAFIMPTISSVYPEALTDTDIHSKAALIQDRLTFIPEALNLMSYFYTTPAINYDLIANEKQKVTKEMIINIKEILLETLTAILVENWNHETLKEVLFAAAEKHELKRGQILWPLRAILTGLEYSPGAFEVAEVLGKEETLKRIEQVQ